MPTPTNDQWLNRRLQFAPRIKERASLGAHQPLVTIAAVKIRAQCGQIKRNLPYRMCATNNSQNPRLSRPSTNFLYRQSKRRRRGNVTEKNHTGARRHAIPKLFDKLL